MNRGVISLFSGAGGLDLGIEAAGFNTRVCVELDSSSCKTLRQSSDWTVIEGDIHDITSRKILREAGLKRREAALLIGGPPCQPFSKSGYWKTGATLRMDDPRASTIREYLRVLRESQPHAFLLENVPGFAYEDMSEGLSFFTRAIRRLNRECRTNYKISWGILNAADFGVPQRRERLFIVGSRDGKDFHFPSPTHGVGASRFVTAWDAIGDLENDFCPVEHQLRGRWADVIPTIPEGKNYLWHTERGGGKPLFRYRSRYWNFLLKLTKKEPSWTILATPGPSTGPFHWKNRRLSVRELMRLQTFPDAFKIFGDNSAVQKQIGNAVPPALAEVMGREIRRQFFDERVSKHVSLLPERVRTIPRATPAKALSLGQYRSFKALWSRSGSA